MQVAPTAVNAESTMGAVLVLTRKADQSIVIGDDIEIKVFEIVGERVRVGIEAPRAVPVFRKELYLDIQGGLAENDDVKAGYEALDRLKSG